MPAVAPPAASGASANSSGSYTFGGNQNVNPVRQTEAPPAVAQPQFQKTFQDSSSSTISGDRWGLSTNFPIPMKASDIDQFSEVYDSPGYHQNTNHDELQKVRDFYGIK